MAAPATVQVFDDLFNSTGAAVANATITATLNADFATSISTLVVVESNTVSTTTNAAGHWSLNLVPNTDLAPAGTTYTISNPFRTYAVTLGAIGPYRSTAPGTIVTTPPQITPTISILDSWLSPNVDLLNAAQAITGVKTFTTNPVLNAGALPESATASLVTDLAARALDSAVVHKTGAEGVAGVKTLSASPVVTSATGWTVDASGNIAAPSFTAGPPGGPYVAQAAGGWTEAKIGDKGGEKINIAVSRYGCDPTGAVASDTGLALAYTDAMASGATLTGPPGIYKFDAGIVVSPAASATGNTKVPSLVFDNVPGRIGDNPNDDSAVTFLASNSFPVGTLFLDYVSAGSSFSLDGAIIRGVAFKCNSRAAGVRVSNSRRFRVQDISIDHAAIPTLGGAVEAAFNSLTQNATVCAYNHFENIVVSYAAKNGFTHDKRDNATYVNCYDLNATQFAFKAHGFAKYFGCHMEGSATGIDVYCGYAFNQFIGWDFFGVPTGNAISLTGLTNSDHPAIFSACDFGNIPGAAPGEEAGSVVDVVNNGQPIHALFNGCHFFPGPNTTDYIYVKAGVMAGSQIRFAGCDFHGAVTTNKFNDASGNAVLRFGDCDGINPLTVTTPGVSTPLTNTFGVSIYVSFIANAAGTTFTVNGKALAATPANAQGGFMWPAGTVMSYVGVPASWAFLGQ